MARTKQSACKNASPCTPPSSSSSYQSIERSPSPPPRPTPPHTSSASPSSNTNQEVLNLIPLSTFLPPLYTRPTPNFAQVPPHLRTRITPPQRSMRVQSGIGTSKSMNPKPHYFIISDSESDDSSDSCPPVAKSPTQPEPQIKTTPTAPTPPPQNPSTTTKPSTPSKSAFSSERSHSTPPHQKWRSINDITTPPPESSPLPQPSPQKHTKRSSSPQSASTSTSSDSEPSPPAKKPKQTTPPLISPAKTKLFQEKWAQRPLPTKGPSVFGDHWYSVLGLRKTEVLANLYEENSTRHLATYLKPLPKVFNNMCQHTLIPHCGSHEYVSDNDALLIHHLLNCKRLNLPYVILQHMICAANKDYKKNTVPYGMVLTKIFRHFGVSLASEKSLIKISKFSTKNLSHMRKTSSAPTPTPPSCHTSHDQQEDDLPQILFHSHHLLLKTSSSIFGISQFLNFPTTDGPSNPSVGPLPSVSSSFASIPSISTMHIPSNTVVATTSQPSAHLHSTPTLATPSNSDIMAALQIIMARQVQHDQETALLRTWMADHLAPKLGIPPPPPHPIPPPSQVPHP
uniref:Uncharacterized protein PB18E9.04c-like n=1 Tax=Cicer arietinum TaxID=3827 RepID=A0A1S2Y3P1_CICAR|nr:uncharacterized protein PB18E9.04c-like [Cicer arietinum]